MTAPTPAAPPSAGGKPAPEPPAPTAPAGGKPVPAARRAGLLVTLVLGGMAALPPLSMDMYLPALPAVTDSLSASAATIQLTLTTCIAGLALGQLVAGPLSDRWGRRRPLLIGMVVYVVATALCALAPGAGVLIALRLVQGLAGAAGIVIARAVVRDLYEGVAMARFFSTLMLISGVAPIVAPLIGGQVLRFTDWRGIFLVLTGVGAVLTLVILKWLPETLPRDARRTGGVRESLRTMRGLLGDRVFTGYVLTGAFSFAALFAYIAASPFVVQEIYGASPQAFSLLFGLNSIGLIAVGQINGRLLVGRVSLDKALACGLVVIVLAAAALTVMTTGVLGEPGLVGVAAGLFVLMAAQGLTMPNTNALALNRTPHAAGSASALIGTSGFLMGAAASPLVGLAGEDTAVPMAVVQLGCGLAAVASFLLLCRPWRTPARL
ncbi:multidrug effflux MFS transporter [Streptomyces tsukubensis]|uniref:MFS transporter n=1 Tax=Streptomyces tsukubensis (strain DSM 42081 / NBRC 108919 / NRRL 18488 / 9993) TaxID=1114943 RepID=A0A7G3UNH3_STRT9|nr:multidrug effflux MFS transporter [Streptomyces tsukubensis]QKM71894.1 MFS transporter [Streptomyces tsukubensis NRRL18488]TAI46513.1 Bcr/CflA family efflux MFS transporter [Streptomyces tsukubensis]